MIKWIREKNIALQLVSLLLAVIAWLYIVGVENPERDIEVRNIQLSVSGREILSDRSLTVTGGLDQTVNLRVRGRGSDLAKIVKNENLKASVDLSDITRPGSYSHVYDVALPSGVTVVEKSPFFINLTVDRVETATIEVKVRHAGNIAEGYIAKAPAASPSVIKVVGPQELLSRISYAEVVLKRENVSSTIDDAQLSYTFVDRDGNEVKSDLLVPDVTKVSVSMEVLKTKEIPLTVQIVEGGGAKLENVDYTLSPDRIRVAGHPDIIDGLNQIVLGSVDLVKVLGSTKQTFEILLPNDVENLNGVTQSTMMLDIKNLKMQSVETSNIEVMHVPAGFKAEVITQMLPVLIRGKEESVARVEPYNIRAVADLQGQDLPAGLHTVAVKVYLDGISDVGVVDQDYSIAIQIVPNAAGRGG